jgi:hypothetical protein
VEERLSGNQPVRELRSRVSEAFPLRVFVRCHECNKGITGSFSTGRSKKYAHYCCRTQGCRAVKFRQENLHAHFVSALHSSFPRPEFVGLFKEIVKNVWRQKHAGQAERATLAAQQTQKLKVRKARLLELLIEDRIDQQTYDDQLKEVGTKLQLAEKDGSSGLIPEEELDSLLDFTDWVMLRIAGVWINASYENKQRIQQAFFPDGLVVSKEGFGTVLRPLFFKEFEGVKVENPEMATPGGFEPPLPP